jgi:hypothetical protein
MRLSNCRKSQKTSTAIKKRIYYNGTVKTVTKMLKTVTVQNETVTVLDSMGESGFIPVR